MTDLEFLARRLLDYADRPAAPEQFRHDQRTAADIVRIYATLLRGGKQPPSDGTDIGVRLARMLAGKPLLPS